MVNTYLSHKFPAQPFVSQKVATESWHLPQDCGIHTYQKEIKIFKQVLVVHSYFDLNSSNCTWSGKELARHLKLGFLCRKLCW